MKNYRFHRLLILLSCLLFVPIQAFAIDPSVDTTRLLASQCAQCHGTTGNTLGGFDSIAGESFQELYNELLEMKADNDNKIMHKQIKAYTDDQVFFIADYYSRLPSGSNGGGGGDDSGDNNSNDNDSGDNDSNDNDSNNSNRVLSKAELKAKKKREKAEAKAAKKRAKEAAKAAKKREKEAKKRAKEAAKAAKRRERENR